MSAHACITLSWDDGHSLDMRIAELMSRRGLRGTFYVPRTAERVTLSAPQIRDLAHTFEVGAHTLDHVVLTNTPDGRAWDEITGAKHWLEDVAGVPCTLFCPPRGRYTNRHLQMMDRAGYHAVRTVELMSVDWPRRKGNLLVMPTTLQAWAHDTRSYVQNAVKRFAWRNLWRYLLHGRTKDWPALCGVLLAETLRQGGVFHLWAHSWEIEECGGWQRLDEVLRLLGDCARDVPALTNGEVCHIIEAERVSNCV